MDIFTIVFWVLAVGLMAFSLIKGKDKTVKAMKRSKAMMGSMMGQIVAIIFLIGLVLAFVPTETIRTVLGGDTPLRSTLLGAAIGSVTLIPAFVAFPLIGSMISAGADIVPAVAFLTTLTMVGVVTFPLEQREFGRKFAISRNVLSFVLAMGIALVMGVIL
jgi:uncharacterized membrane protein YraQ (UPF0718 family)